MNSAGHHPRFTPRAASPVWDSLRAVHALALWEARTRICTTPENEMCGEVKPSGTTSRGIKSWSAAQEGSKLPEAKDVFSLIALLVCSPPPLSVLPCC